MRDKNHSTNYDGYDHNSIIAIADRIKGATDRLADAYNRIIFVLEGSISYSLTPGPEKFALGGQIIFVPSIRSCSYKAIDHSRILVFKLKRPVSLYTNFCTKRHYVENIQKSQTLDQAKQNDCLQINASLRHFAEGVITNIEDGIHCNCWYEMKVRELFILLKSYYPGYETEAFLREASNTDTQFSEHVLKHWSSCRSVEQLAASINMTIKQFSSRFVPIFGITPGKWMMKEKARVVYEEIASTGKPFKQIAFENGFTSDSLFTRFCKSELGKTPSDLRVTNK